MDLGEFLAFRKFFAPIAIQVIFWLGVLGVIVASLASMFTHGFIGFIAGIFFLVLGIVLVRIYCELLILLFRIYDELVAIRTGRPPTDAGFEVQSLRPSYGSVSPVSPIATTPASVPLSPTPPL